MEDINENNLSDFIANYEIGDDEPIYQFSDGELYDLYVKLKHRADRSMTQAFIGQIGNLNPKWLHSFVSRNAITDDTFKSKLIRLLFVTTISADATAIVDTVWQKFPAQSFTRNRSPNAPNSRAAAADASNEIENLRRQLLTKEAEVYAAKAETELYRQRCATKDVELEIANDKLEKQKNKQTENKSTQTATGGSQQTTKKPFNRFV